jgi:hypothetical protein
MRKALSIRRTRCARELRAAHLDRAARGHGPGPLIHDPSAEVRAEAAAAIGHATRTRPCCSSSSSGTRAS